MTQIKGGYVMNVPLPLTCNPMRNNNDINFINFINIATSPVSLLITGYNGL